MGVGGQVDAVDRDASDEYDVLNPVGSGDSISLCDIENDADCGVAVIFELGRGGRRYGDGLRRAMGVAAARKGVCSGTGGDTQRLGVFHGSDSRESESEDRPDRDPEDPHDPRDEVREFLLASDPAMRRTGLTRRPEDDGG